MYIQTGSVEIFFQARRSVARLVETLRLPQHFGARAGNEKKPVEVAGYFWSVPAPQHAELDKLQASPTLPAPRFSLFPQTKTPPTTTRKIISRRREFEASSISISSQQLNSQIQPSLTTRSAHRKKVLGSSDDTFSSVFFSFPFRFHTHPRWPPRLVSILERPTAV